MMNQLRRSVLAMAVAGISVASFGQTSVKQVPNGWHLKDQKTSGIYGISLDKAYQFVKGKKSQTVIVAVIDSGIDTTHEDLKPILWKNPKEISGNGIDDDGNGYVDDIYGWNFLGGRDGNNHRKDHRYNNDNTACIDQLLFRSIDVEEFFVDIQRENGADAIQFSCQ